MSYFLEKSGFILSSAFFQMLDLHGIKLSAADLASVRHYYEKNGGYVKYKDVLHQININKEVVDPVGSEWLFVKPVGGVKGGNASVGGNS